MGINIDNHGYIKLIEHTLKNNNFSVNQVCKDTGLTTKQFNFAKEHIFMLSHFQENNLNPEIKQDWELSPSAYFNYLQYLEFKHSIKSSRISLYVAFFAVVISIIVGVLNCK